MLANKGFHESSMIQMLSSAIKLFQDQGVICEISSPSSVNFSSTLPKERVKEIFEASSVPMQPSFESAEQGCRGTATVQGIPRADE